MKQHLILLILLMITAVLVVGQLYLTIPLTGAIAEAFSVTAEQAAWAGSAFGFAYACGFLVFGPLSDRIGRRVILLAGLAATALATALVGIAGSMPLYLAARALQGFVAASFPPVALSLISETLSPPHRPFGISLISFAFLAAAPVAQFAGAAAPLAPGSLMLLLAPGYLLVMIGLFLALPQAAGTPQATGAPAEHVPSGTRSLARNGMVLACWAAAVTVLFGFVSFQVATMAGAGGFDPQLVRLAGLPPLALCLLVAPISLRFGSAVTARTGLGLSALGLGLAAAGPQFMIPASLLVSAGVALAVPGLIATVAGAAMPQNRGLALSLYTFFLFVGASIAPPVIALLVPIGGFAVFGLPAVLLIAAIFVVTAAQRLRSTDDAAGDQVRAS